MGELGDILELVALSRQRWTTVRATVTQHVNHERQRLAMERSQPSFAPQRSTPPGDPWVRRSAEKPERTTTVQVWARGAAQLRVEALSPAENGDAATYLAITNGDSPWTRHGSGEIHVPNPASAFRPPDPSGWPMILNPGEVVKGHVVTPDGRGERASRPTLRAILTPEGDPSMVLPGRVGMVIFQTWFGDETTVEFDAATGVALFIDSRIDGESFRTFTVTSIDFDANIDDALFAELPPPDAPTTDPHKMAEPIDVVAARVPFAVFVPPGGACSGLYTNARKDHPAVVHVHQMPDRDAMFRRATMTPPKFVHLTESASADGVADPADWEPVTLADGPGWCWQPIGGGEVHVRLDRSGTYIWLRGLHDREAALDLAGHLEQVPVAS
jgi:hypothetical protein